MSFDPWTATEEEMEADEQIASKCREASLRFFQWSDAQGILALKTKVEAGDGRALLQCVSRILSSGLAAPEWLDLAFNNCYNSVLGGHHLSWDDAFGKPHPRMVDRKRLEAKRRDTRRMVRIGSFIGGQLRTHTNKSKAYEIAADKFDIEPRKASDYYKRYLAIIPVKIPATERQLKRMREGEKQAVITK